MNHRHLFPNEIDLLVDGEVGFGVAPLKAHLLECSHCRGQYEEARIFVDALEALPHFAPSVAMADRVMAHVPVYVPWHVAARDSLAGMVPSSRPARVAVAALVSTSGALLTALLLWLLPRGDALLVALEVAGDRAQALALGGASRVALGLFGEAAFTAVRQSGALGVALLGGGFLVASAGTAFGLRSLAAAASRRGS